MEVYRAVDRNALLSTLPPEWPQDGLQERIRRQVATSRRSVVVLDDDPTGSQTMHDIDVLTDWDVQLLRDSLSSADATFYILTNSRSLPEANARALNAEIAANLVRASHAYSRTGASFDLVSRSDSTLRGHYPAEVDALQETLERDTGLRIDGHVIIPFFLEGGRLTIDDVHWVTEGDLLVPAAQTEYARDPVFGYSHSNLREWTAEKSHGRFAPEEVVSISIADLRQGGPRRIEQILVEAEDGRPLILNCASYGDLRVFVAGLLAAETAGKRFIFRTGASFVKERSAVGEQGMLEADTLYGQLPLAGSAAGGIVVVGSYIKKSGDQLQTLLGLPNVTGHQLSVMGVLDEARRPGEIAAAAQALGEAIRSGRTGVVYTSRAHVSGTSGQDSLRIGGIVSDALVAALRMLEVTPRFIVAKGGITAHDMATAGLGVRRARVLGQVLPGVSAWRLGPESRYPGVPYIVFPGNVGGPEALAEVVRKVR